jgi:CheY-like chemotaxis protein
MLDAMRDILAHTLGGNIAVRVDIQPMLPAVTADRGGLETVLVNLAANARDAMPQGGTITLAARQDTVRAGVFHHQAARGPGRYVCLVVSDNGTGMSPETLARAADPFFTTKPPGSGTGLGLSMAKGFAEQSGGGLEIASAPGCGTTVTLWLPVAGGDGGMALRRPVKEPVAAAKPAVRVLLVDDEEMVRETLAAGLEGAGLAVLVAASGAEAVALLDAGEPVDLLVTDLSMPGMDGMTLIRHARVRRKGLPVLVLTGFVDTAAQNADAPGEVGPFGVVRKPISAAQLAGRVAEALAAAKAGSGLGDCG